MIIQVSDHSLYFSVLWRRCTGHSFTIAQFITAIFPCNGFRRCICLLGETITLKYLLKNNNDPLLNRHNFNNDLIHWHLLW